MKLSFLLPIKPVYAHCDLPCGVYDPAQARIEAQSVKAIMEKFPGLDDHNKTRAIIILEERAELVKHHLMVLWADYFKPEHLEVNPDLHTKFWLAIKLAGDCKHHLEVDYADKLLEAIDEIAEIFWQTKKA
ncbi:MAG: superoxide dismutase, Ni [Patescibacteria group bacterium]|nr:superoxide dismutase, Ni [Patescibacteria group bacterium]